MLAVFCLLASSVVFLFDGVWTEAIGGHVRRGYVDKSGRDLRHLLKTLT